MGNKKKLFINITVCFVLKTVLDYFASYRHLIEHVQKKHAHFYMHYYLDHIIIFGGKETHKKQKESRPTAQTPQSEQCVLSGDRRINRAGLPPLSAGGEQSDLLFVSAVL